MFPDFHDHIEPIDLLALKVLKIAPSFASLYDLKQQISFNDVSSSFESVNLHMFCNCNSAETFQEITSYTDDCIVFEQLFLTCQKLVIRIFNFKWLCFGYVTLFSKGGSQLGIGAGVAQHGIRGIGYFEKFVKNNLLKVLVNQIGVGESEFPPKNNKNIDQRFTVIHQEQFSAMLNPSKILFNPLHIQDLHFRVRM